MKLFTIVLLSIISLGALAQNKQITIHKEVDENGNVIRYDSTVVESSGDFDMSQFENLEKEFEELAEKMAAQMQSVQIDMEASMKELEESMMQLFPEQLDGESDEDYMNRLFEGFPGSDQLKGLMDIDMDSLMQQQFKLFENYFDLEDDSDAPKSDEILDEQMY